MKPKYTPSNRIKPVVSASFALCLASFSLTYGNEVTLAPTWNLFDPEGNSSLSDQSSTGFTATISDVLDNEDPVNRPAIYQEFDAIDLSEVGASVRAQFDVTLQTDITEANDTDFRFAFVDTASNFEIITGMIDLGSPSGTALRLRIDNRIGAEDELNPPGPFIPMDYSNFGEGGGTLGGSGASAGSPGLRYSGDVSSFDTTVTRISADEIEIVTTWTVNSIDPTFRNSVTTIVNETTPVNADDIPPGGHFTQLNGFGFRINDGDPFNSDGDPATMDSGSYKVSNLRIDRTKIIPMSPTWTLYDPEGNSSLSGESETGFVATISEVVSTSDGTAFPTVVQEFPPLDISQVGQSLEVSFDIKLLTQIYDANDSDFRFAFYDTATNHELIVGMNDLGPPGGTGMRMRADDNVSTEAEIDPPGPFVTGNYGNFASGPTNFASGGTPGAPGIQFPGMVNHFVTRVTRTSETLLDCRTYWTVEDTYHKSASLIGTFDEANPPNPTNVPPSGHFTQLNGFGFVLLDLDPFNDPNDPGVTSGSYEILNFMMRYCAGPVTVESSLRIVSVVQDPGSGDITITWESENGVDYDVLDSADLSTFGPTPIASVSATGPTASYTIPGATVTANGKRFYKIRRP